MPLKRPPRLSLRIRLRDQSTLHKYDPFDKLKRIRIISLRTESTLFIYRDYSSFQYVFLHRIF